MADISESELSYYAGFFDGEGCVAVYPKKYVASLTNTDVRPLVRAKDIWGGAISVQRAIGRKGAVQDLYRWQIYGHESRKFLEQIAPFCVVKKDQIAVYLSILGIVPKGRGTPTQRAAVSLVVVGAQKLRLLKRGGA